MISDKELLQKIRKDTEHFRLQQEKRTNLNKNILLDTMRDNPKLNEMKDFYLNQQGPGKRRPKQAAEFLTVFGNFCSIENEALEEMYEVFKRERDQHKNNEPVVVPLYPTLISIAKRNNREIANELFIELSNKYKRKTRNKKRA